MSSAAPTVSETHDGAPGAREVDGGCLQVLGLDAPAELERALRDAGLGPVGGGNDEIMKEILGRSLGL